MTPQRPATDLDAAEAHFRRGYLAAVTLEGDRAAADELGREARPALEALARWSEMSGDEALVRSEAVAMVSLLGRRAARLGISPTAALAICEGLWRSRPGRGDGDDPEAERTLRAVCFEGYVAAREEAESERRAAQWVEAQPLWSFVEGGLLCAPVGAADAAQLTDLAERVVRELFRREAKVAWLDLSGLAEPDEPRAAALLGLVDGARMLGCDCVISVGDRGWRQALEAVASEPELLRLAPDFPAGLNLALSLVDHELRPRGALSAAIRRLRGKRGSSKGQ